MNYFVNTPSRMKRGRGDDGFTPGEMVTKKQKGGSEGSIKKRTEEVEEVQACRLATSFPVDLSDWFVVGSDGGFDVFEDAFGLQVSVDYSLVEQLCLGLIPSELLSFCGDGDLVGAQMALWEEDDIWRLMEIHEAPSI